MHHALIVYDIAGNDRRQAVSDRLSASGARVQLSVFECRFDQSDELSNLVAALEGMIDPVEDQIRIYSVSPLSDEVACQILGERTIEEHRGFWLL